MAINNLVPRFRMRLSLSPSRLMRQAVRPKHARPEKHGSLGYDAAMATTFGASMLVVLVALAAGCGGNGAIGACAAPVGSCADTNGMACTEFSGTIGDSTVASEMADCIADGEAWSTSALAIALGTSARTVQRALEALAMAGKVQAIGGGRTRRWLTPTPGAFSTLLLLPGPLPGG